MFCLSLSNKMAFTSECNCGGLPIGSIFASKRGLGNVKLPSPTSNFAKTTRMTQISAEGSRNKDGLLGDAPWNLFFDLRERETEWSEGNQERLVVAFAAEELEISPAEVTRRLQELTVLLPDISLRLHKLRPSIVATLIRDTKDVARRLVRLKATFPKANLDTVVSAEPQILLRDPSEVEREAAEVADLLGVQEIDSLVEQYPRILDAGAVEEALSMLRAVMPGKDPRATLVASPSFISRVERGGRRLGDNPDPGSDYS
uniref:Uncharacterized protein n=1 Tax=Tetraselmis sp. GSL018 TaxID=582737 RepID=A0A061RH13_9CHLO